MRSFHAVLLTLLFFTTKIFSQTLTVNTNQLSFGNVFENSPDSLPLIISNPLNHDVTVTGIRFYNTYGFAPFSTSLNSFIISSASSTTIWIRFSPAHNIFHNSEMIIENTSLRGYPSIDLQAQGKYSDTYYDLSENLAEENLKNILGIITGNGFVSLGYNVARDSMFMNIDNKKVNGQGASQNTIECLYTGREAVGYTDRTDCQNNFSFNTEHVCPQSFFSSAEPMRSDLHHLFPTDDMANNQRGSNPFDVVTNPSWSVGGSLSDGTVFEPRDVSKGNVARSLFYFVLRYQNYNNFLNSQETILKTWHRNFPPTAKDLTRNGDIFAIQHNKNPFIDYPAFADRINSISQASLAPLISSIDLSQDTIIYGVVQPGSPATYNYVIVNNGNTNIQLSNFNLSHSPELTFSTPPSDTTILPGESLALQIQCLTSLPDSIRGFLTFNSNATGNISVSVPVFVNDLIFTLVAELQSGFTVSPNPATDKIFIISDKFFSNYTATLYDVAGKNISFSSFNTSSEIDLDGISKGIYFLRIASEDKIVVRKIVLQ